MSYDERKYALTMYGEVADGTEIRHLVALALYEAGFTMRDDGDPVTDSTANEKGAEIDEDAVLYGSPLHAAIEAVTVMAYDGWITSEPESIARTVIDGLRARGFLFCRAANEDEDHW